MPSVATEQSHGEDLVRSYLREIGRYPLLGPDKEVALAKAIEAGTKAGQNLDGAESLLSDEKRADLQNRLDEAGAARREFAEANLRLVVSIARRYQGFGLHLLDLIQDGNVGLLRAVEKYDWRRGFKFSTYATWWIRQGITRGLADRSRTIRLPVHVGDVVNRIRRCTADLSTNLGREPTDDELAAAMEMDVEQLLSYRRVGMDTWSLQTPLGEDGELEFQDLLVDEACDKPLDAAVRSASADELREALKTLTPREQRVLELRFGLADGQPRTLDQIGVEFELTRERIRQIEAKAIAKLRHPIHSKALQTFSD